MKIIVKIDGLSHGPYSMDQVRAMVLDGKLQPQQEVKIIGQDEWIPLSSLPGLNESKPEIASSPVNVAQNPIQRGTQEVPVRKVGFLLGVGILFFPYIFSWFTLRKGHTTQSKVISFVWLGVTVLMIAVQQPQPRRDDQTASSTQKTLASAPEPASSISWQQVDAIYNLKSDSTDMQKEDAWKRFKGKRVVWSGEVSEISTGMLGGLTLQIKMNSDTFTSDLLIRLKKSERDKAASLSKGSRVSFSGVLDNWGTILPITLNDGEILR